jgi:hypothetical protein
MPPRNVLLSLREPATEEPELPILLRVTVIEPTPQRGFPSPDAGDKKFNSRLVAPTLQLFSPQAFRRSAA